MTRDEHLMVIGMEECDELSQRLSKALRFGLNQIQPGQLDSNRGRIVAEMNDLLAALDMLGLYQPNREQMDAKKAKVERFLAFSVECGTLSDSAQRREGGEAGEHCACGKYIIPVDAACVVTHTRESHTRPSCFPGEAPTRTRAAMFAAAEWLGCALTGNTPLSTREEEGR
jgi:hypothetical protein